MKKINYILILFYIITHSSYSYSNDNGILSLTDKPILNPVLYTIPLLKANCFFSIPSIVIVLYINDLGINLLSNSASSYIPLLYPIAIISNFNEGLLTFYNGLKPRLLKVVPGQGIIFASYESSRCYVRIDLPLTIDDNSLVSMIKAGGLMPEV